MFQNLEFGILVSVQNREFDQGFGTKSLFLSLPPLLGFKRPLPCLSPQVFEEPSSDYDHDPEIFPSAEYNCHATGIVPLYPSQILNTTMSVLPYIPGPTCSKPDKANPGLTRTLIRV